MNDYLTANRTISTLYKCSERTIRRRLSLVVDSFTATYPKSAVIILDTTYFSKTFGVMLFQDASSGKILYRKFVKNETNRDYLDGLRYIAERGTVIKAVVCDGHVGLLQAIGFCPVQMCQFHQFQIVRRLLTNNPHLPAGVELLALMRRMFSMRKEEFITAFDKWCDKWKEFLNERTLLISGKTTYTHRRLRTARRSIKTHLPWLYTCEEHPNMQIPNTTNLLEGFNSQLKRALHNHNGLNEANKKKFIDGFINTKKVGWNNQPTKCPLRLDYIYGKLFGDKGYIDKNLFQRLFIDGIQLITKLKSNMKGTLMSVSDRLLLRKRAIIETVNDELKNIAQVEHSRHRCFDNFIVNLLGAIAIYCLFPKKPCINVQRTIDIQLALF